MRIRNIGLPLAFFAFHLIATAQNDTIHLNQEVDSATVKANPWQQASGELLLSPYLSYYQATSFRDDNGNKQDFSNNGKFHNYNPRLYFSLPLRSDKLNLFGSIPYVTNTYEDDFVKNTNQDFGDIELGLRFNITSFGDTYIMGSIIGYIPAYTNDQAPSAGYELFGIEPRLILAGTSRLLGEYNNFHKIEVGVRYFFPQDPLQIRFLISQGYRVTDQFLLLGELDGIFSFSDNSRFFENNLQQVAQYQTIKASFNLGYEFSPALTIYGGLFHDIYNRNSGIGSGFQTFAVIKLD